MCRANFNIMDFNDEEIYHLDLRINSHDDERKIVQDEFLNGKWISKEKADMPELRAINVVIVELTPEKYYDVIMNDERINTRYPVKMDRLKLYKGIVIDQGKCLTIDLDQSFVVTLGES